MQPITNTFILGTLLRINLNCMERRYTSLKQEQVQSISRSENQSIEVIGSLPVYIADRQDIKLRKEKKKKETVISRIEEMYPPICFEARYRALPILVPPYELNIVLYAGTGGGVVSRIFVHY